MTQEQIIKFKSKLTELANKHKDELTLIKKELTEQIRSVKLIIITAVFVFFAVMNTTIAKLTPMLYELLADTMAQSGMTVTEVSVSAMDSWMQFFKMYGK